MNRSGKFVLSFLFAFGFLAVASQSADAHTAFKKHLEKKYGNIKVKCNACHVEDEPKTERNKFGNLFFKKLSDQELTQQWREFEDRTEKKKFEAEVMVPAFDKALEAVKKMTNDDDVSYDELIKTGKMPEIALKEED